MKKIIYIIPIIVILCFCILSNRPVLYGLAEKTEFCIGDGGSSSKIIELQNDGVAFFCKAYGETVTVEDVSKDEIFKIFSARLVKVEKIESGTSYYGYSDKIKYCATVGGERVNIHVFVGEETKVGSPLIFGGY